MRWKSFCISFFLLGVSLSSLLAEEILIYGHVPDFTFQERSGNSIKRSDFDGQAWISDFIFTRCQGMCPLMSGRMAVLQEELGASGIKLVSFSVDPEYDTPQILSEYADRFKAKEGIWFFLTGEKQTMWNFIEEGFQLGVAKPSPEDLANGAEPVMHSNRFVLVDQKGQIRGYYDTSEPEKMKQLVRDALSLLRTARFLREYFSGRT